MAFCNFKLYNFEGKVCHVELQRGKSVETVKHVLQHLAHSSETLLNSLTTKYAAWEMFSKQACGQRVLLALDNITEDPEIIDEVRVYLSAEFASGSRILLSARSLKILVKFLPAKSCMHVPNLTEEEAIDVLLERTSVKEQALRAEDRAFALKCAKRCWFKETPADNGMVEGARVFHPLALKAFGGYLFTKFDSDLSRWISELSDFPKAGARDLQDVLAVLDKAYLDLGFKYQTIFILLSVYMPPKMSLHKVFEWLAIICNTEIDYIHKAVGDLIQKAFIERVEPEVRIHDLLVEFAQNKASKMEKWLWVNENIESPRQLISEDNGGFELIKFEDCKYRTPSMVSSKFLRNLLSLQLVDMENLSKLDLSSMDNVRSVIIHNCRELQQIEGMENLSNLAWLQICRVKPSMKLPMLSSLNALQHLKIDIPNCAQTGWDGKSPPRIHLGDLTCCVFLKEISVRSPFLAEFPTVKGLQFLEKLDFIDCFYVTGTLDCTGCSQLRKIVFNFCCQMAHPPILSGCSKLSEIVLWQCHTLITCPQIDGLTCLETLELCISSEAGVGNPTMILDSCSRLKNIQLWNMRQLMKLPQFSALSCLMTIKLHRCGICEPPDFAGCPLLENVSFFTLKKLRKFPSFSGLTALRNLSLCNCKRVLVPPDISGCSQLQVFHLLYNDNMQALPQMANFHTLEEIKLSWHAREWVKFFHMESDSDSEADDTDSEADEYDLELCLNNWKYTIIGLDYLKLPVQLKECVWLQSNAMRAKMYVRGGNLYYSITATNHGREIHRGHLHQLCGWDLQEYVKAEITRIRRVDEMKWGRKMGYDVKLSEGGLHEPVLQLFEGLKQEDYPGTEAKKKGKELWLQMWKAWEDKWEEESECVWEEQILNVKVRTLDSVPSIRIGRNMRYDWKKNRNYLTKVSLERNLEFIERNIQNYWKEELKERKVGIWYLFLCKNRRKEREKRRKENLKEMNMFHKRRIWEINSMKKIDASLNRLSYMLEIFKEIESWKMEKEKENGNEIGKGEGERMGN